MPISFLISSSLIKSPFKTLGVILSIDQDQYELAPTREAALEARDMQRASMGMPPSDALIQTLTSKQQGPFLDYLRNGG